MLPEETVPPQDPSEADKDILDAIDGWLDANVAKEMQVQVLKGALKRRGVSS